MKAIFFLLLATTAVGASAQSYKCSIYATTTSSHQAEEIVLTAGGAEVPFGSRVRGRGQWSLALSKENVDGLSLLQLSLSTGSQSAAVLSARAGLNADVLGLAHNTSQFADVVCKRITIN